MYQLVVFANSPTYYQNCIAQRSANSIMLYNSKEYINALEQVVKIFEDGLCLFPCSYFSGVHIFSGLFC